MCAMLKKNIGKRNFGKKGNPIKLIEITKKVF